LEAIETIQGPIYINRCFLRSFQCPLQQQCPLHKKLEKIQDDIVSALKSTTFEEIRDRKETELG
jgi:DNA-binding IscR family transcriptional regulator